MTRINLVDIESLSNQHLLAEYRELPRASKLAEASKVNPKDIPIEYVLGKGHVIFFFNKADYLETRHEKITKELLKRGFTLTLLSPFKMSRKYPQIENWKPSPKEIALSEQRIQEKLLLNPSFYTFYKEPSHDCKE